MIIIPKKALGPGPPWRIGSVLAFHALIPSSILGADPPLSGEQNPTAGVRDGPCNPSYWEAERGQWMLSKMLGAPSRVCRCCKAA